MQYCTFTIYGFSTPEYGMNFLEILLHESAVGVGINILGLHSLEFKKIPLKN